MTHSRWGGRVALLLMAAGVTACSSVPYAQRESAERARFEAYAGKPVEQFTWLGHYYSWEYLGHYELAVWTTPFDAYLIKVLPPCEDLPFVQRIGLTSTARTVSSRFDFVLLHPVGAGRGELPWRCQIVQIRPVAYRRMEHDLRAGHGGSGA